MDVQKLTISFVDEKPALATRFANELSKEIRHNAPDVEVSVARDDPENQDFGATLVLILGTPAIAALATALGNWLVLRNSASITMRNEKGEEIIIDKANSGDIDKLLKRLSKFFDA
jgi:hypothetical protein